MRLVVFANNYPFGVGEDFLEGEMRAAENHFKEIIIVSAAKTKKDITKYVPQNAKVVTSRMGLSRFSRYIQIVKCFFKFSFWKEVLSGVSERGFKNIIYVIKKTFLTLDYTYRLKKSEKMWCFNDKETIYYSYWLNEAATYLAKRKEKLNGICISRAHAVDCFYDRGFTPFRREQLRGLDAVFTISQAGKDDILQHYGDAVPDLNDKVFVSKLGIEIPQIIVQMNEPQNERVIVSCSNVIGLKRLDLLIEALALCDDVNIKWIHFGDGCEMENITALAEKMLNQKPNISFEFKGRKPNREVLSFYDNSQVDLFVNCSDIEGIPVSVMEALVRGIPSIARNVGANSELVSNDCGALLQKNITAIDLSEAIMGIFTLSEEEYLIKRENAIKTVKNGFDAKQNYIRFFEQIIEMSMQNG